MFQCSRCCTDELWDAVKPVEKMMKAIGDGITLPEDLILHCPHCGVEMFPWVRGYGNFLQGTKYEEEYQKILFIELGVGRITPMFIQESFWTLTLNLPNAYYISINEKYDFLPKVIEDKGFMIVDDIGKILKDVKNEMEKEN